MTKSADRPRRLWPALLVATAILVAVLGLALSHRPRATGATQGIQVLRVGNQLGTAHALMKAAGVLSDTPYKIEWSLFPAASPLLEALRAGAIDVGGVGDAPFAFAYASGAQIKVVQAYRYENPAYISAIVVPQNSPLKTARDLVGHTVATVRGSAGENLVLKVLEHNGLKPSSVKFVFLDNGDAKAALASGSVDAWATWSSYMGIALLHDHDRAIADGQGLKQDFGFQAATDDAAAKKHAIIDDFLRRLNRAYKWAEGHPEAYAAVLSHETGIPLDVARLTAHAVYHPVPIAPPTVEDTRETLQRYHDAGVIAQVPDLSGAFDPSFNDAKQP